MNVFYLFTNVFKQKLHMFSKYNILFLSINENQIVPFNLDNNKKYIETTSRKITCQSIVKTIVSISGTWINLCLYIIMEFYSQFT